VTNPSRCLSAPLDLVTTAVLDLLNANPGRKVWDGAYGGDPTKPAYPYGILYRIAGGSADDHDARPRRRPATVTVAYQVTAVSNLRNQCEATGRLFRDRLLARDDRRLGVRLAMPAGWACIDRAPTRPCPASTAPATPRTRSSPCPPASTCHLAPAEEPPWVSSSPPGVLTMSRFFRKGVTKFVFCPTVAGTSPTRAEITAGTEITDSIAAVNGFSLSNSPVTTPDMGSRFDKTVPGIDSAGDSSLNMWDEILDGGTTDPARDVLAKDTELTVSGCPTGTCRPSAARRGRSPPPASTTRSTCPRPASTRSGSPSARCPSRTPSSPPDPRPP
jgi:hypothetical protein